MKWRVRRFDNDPETEPPQPARNLSHAVLIAVCIDDRFKKGRKCSDGSYHDIHTGIVIEKENRS